MSFLNVEIEGDKILRLAALPDGRIEVVSSERELVVMPFRSVKTGGMTKDTVFATIPRNRRAEVADWLASA